MPAAVFEPVIGLEVHAQLLTNTKIFCGCPTRFDTPPNTNVCPVCLGHPGVLPVLNKKVVEFAVKMGLALGCTVNQASVIARKNYFYPDLPKGYQISQYDKPICEDGSVILRLKDGSEKTIRVKRIHIEEDAGKSVHDAGACTAIDVNRCGVPLIEIVTEPDISSGEEAKAYLAIIRQTVQYLGICDGNMEEGSLRCDANVSIRPAGTQPLGTKAEVKNMNSFRNVERAIAFEIQRQTEIIEDGGKVVQQTLLWDADAGEARPMRSKEEAHDYRYFPEPDLYPVKVSDGWLEEIRASLPELPEKRKDRFTAQYGIPEYDAEVLTAEKSNADYFERVCASVNDYKLASNWVMGEVQRILNERKISISEFPVPAEELGGLINFISDGTISGKIAKDVFAVMMNEGKSPKAVIEEKGLVQISDESQLRALVAQAFDRFPSELEQLLEGKEKVFGFFLGQIMKLSAGKANPQTVNSLLRTMSVERKN